MIDKKDCIVISGANCNRYNAEINHKKYCLKNNFHYKFSIREDINPPYFIKCYCILEALEKYKYILWMDDDAFFLDKNWDFRTIFDSYNEDCIVTRGRAKKSGITLFNNGIMFIRQTDAMKILFNKMIETTFDEVRKNYKSHWGPIDRFDQSRMIYLTQKLFPEKIKILEYPGFNAHEESFRKKEFFETNPPLIHITGKHKEDKLEKFQNRYNIDLF